MDHENVVESVANWFKLDPKVNLVSKGLGDFPNPDLRVQFKDGSLALVECKPSNAVAREYLTGYGQALAYLINGDYSYLAIPKIEMDAFKKYFWYDSLGLLSIIDNKIDLLRKAEKSKVIISKEEPLVRGYAYYRDLRPPEIFYLLNTIQITNYNKKYETTQERIQTVRDNVWEGIKKIRKIRSEEQKGSQLTNIYLLFRDIGLITQDYLLTNDSISLLKIGNITIDGPFLDKLAKQFLINGNFIDILTIIQKLNDTYSGFQRVNEFLKKLEIEIVKEKLATTKKTNIRRDLQDIPRILRDLKILSEWKKVGLVYRININWKKVLSIIREKELTTMI